MFVTAIQVARDVVIILAGVIVTCVAVIVGVRILTVTRKVDSPIKSMLGRLTGTGVRR